MRRGFRSKIESRGPLARLIGLGAALLFLAGFSTCTGSSNCDLRSERPERWVPTALSAADQANEDAGFQYEESIDRELARETARGIFRVFRDEPTRFAGRCQNFIDEQGRLGPWGRTVMEELDRYPNSFQENVPRDIAGDYCPNYESFDPPRRKMYWVHVFASLAHPESSCNPNAINRGAPNGSAIGLFQLEPNKCDHVSPQDLMNPYINIRCAVKMMARELGVRDTIGAAHSRRGGTYWGPLRTDDDNRGRGGDIVGACRFRYLVRRFGGCSDEPQGPPLNTIAECEQRRPRSQ